MSSNNIFWKKNQQATSIAASLATVIAATTISTIAQAGTIRHDRSDSQYTNLANSFPSVGYFAAKKSSLFGDSSWSCSGTLIDSIYVLTAAHCLEDNNQFFTSGTFFVGGNRYSVKSAASNSAWNGDLQAGNDIAILQLVNPVSNVQPATLYSDFNEDSKVGTYVGFGATGNGLTGQYLPSATKRAGENLINVASYSDRLLLSDFSVPSSVDIFEIQNIGGKCLDVQGGEVSKIGTPVWLWDCNHTNAQKWYRDGSQIKNLGGKSLDVQWSNFNDGTTVWIWDNNGTKAQQWSSPSFNSYDKIQNVEGRCLDVQWGLTFISGTRVQLWDCNGTDAQKWKANNLLSYNPDPQNPALDLEYQLGQGDSGGGLFIDGKVAGVNSFRSGNSSYESISGTTRVSYFGGFIENAKKALANIGKTGFSSGSKNSGSGSGGGIWIDAPLAPEFDFFDESFQVSVIDDNNFEYLISLDDNPGEETPNPERVPEPSFTWSLLAIGVSVTLALKRKCQANDIHLCSSSSRED